MSPNATPSVGRVVHYTNLGDKDGRYPPEQQAAIITKVRHQGDMSSDEWQWSEPWVVSLAILYPTGLFFMQDVPFSAEYRRGHWSWPPRVS